MKIMIVTHVPIIMLILSMCDTVYITVHFHIYVIYQYSLFK